MKSIIFGLALASAAAAQVANGAVSMVPATPTPVDNGAAAYSAPTAAPSASSFYDVMPYDSYMSGGYKSLDCGYGYYKGSDGSCQTESWVRVIFFIMLNVKNLN